MRCVIASHAKAIPDDVNEALLESYANYHVTQREIHSR